ncbi:glycosyltransferase family 4 protein [Candidatus Microgenomates bacterium]|nr:glycosyltransferase family 4 protein [Candidatus Microgenomates bacterium]
MFKIATGFSELLPVKNIAGVIRAVARVKTKNLALWIVGDGRERDKLESLARSLRVEARFWGRVPNPRAREILRQADVFVLNSFHEGMPHALLEALAEGVPVVATRIPAVTEILTDQVTGLFVDVGDERSLAGAIQRLVGKPGLRAKLAQNGRQLFQKNFTWEAHLRQLERVFGK